MLAELPSLGVHYLIVHKVDWLTRNRLDDATLYQRLAGAEYYSNNWRRR